MSVPWPIIGVESRGGTVVRIRHADSTIADHDFSYLLGGAGVFAHLTDEMIPEAGICDGGTVGWETEAGVIDLAPDALWEHATLGLCPGSVCRGWTPAHTVLVHHGGR
ncbi:hypothetical protein AXK57_00145 [Tsukamurella pulmonis]|uniref:hypothetical protein n=1 Tax=Tsukamurella pulmonis TaxID=47312 RepID=UPI000794782D|nr:hypothetical protein [Tsukamurella pulmonis]KXP12707.1 hypothetical protein AXK57_00145 [Tsukamurella pulmonis]